MSTHKLFLKYKIQGNHWVVNLSTKPIDTHAFQIKNNIREENNPENLK